ncbi:glycerol-3-phosphate dehydrogenase subunit GlpB [Symbiopectobacterium purcellii]|uniref:Anaerobic glycerol-3-phosphate dehydrogenase subunit B n=1 Tax=Symbiopectobacterium purcellii TaxID=2871826 RepID=A0ABX9AKR3_9ENTR|nr:glycerol-3-phosphate dehydrogenase subunit GlpB [Symbiopectobacterium purcellii]QZN95773.1 glycerol-3-phosphate dehydrogenase subunit GlpB [Symbiopectobacterium purcellii]
MRYDVVIIGGGLAGLTCGIRLSEQGKHCAIVSSGQSALHFSSGSLDLLSFLPDGEPVHQPLEALSALASQAPEHPYSLMGEAAVRRWVPEAEALLARCGATMTGSHQHNHLRLTPLGKYRPCWLSPPEIVTREQGKPLAWRAPLIVGIEGFLDFQSSIVADALQAQGIAAKSADLRLPALDRLRGNPSEFRAINIARVLDLPENASALLAELTRLSADHDAVILPACLGLDTPDAVAMLQSALGKPVSLLPTLPPSLPGVRLHQAMVRRFRQLGGMVMPGDKVERAVLGETEKALYTRNHVDIPLRAQQVVLASGSFFNNGLVAEFDRVVEPVFGLDVHYAALRSDWSREQVLAPQPYRLFGVETDEKLRPRIKGVTVPGVYAIGAVLAGFDPLAQGCGAGVSLLSALSVADTLLQGEVA